MHQLHTTELSAKAGAALWKTLGLNKPTSTTVASTPSGRPPFDHILLEDVAVGPMDVAFQELPWLPKLPPGRGHVTFLARQVSSSLTAAPTAGNFEFSLTDFALGTTENPLLTLPQMTAQAAIQSDGAWMVQEFKLAPTQIKFTTAQLAEFGLSGWLPSLEISGTLGAEAHDLKIQGSTVASDASQKIELNHVQVRRPGADHDLITWDEFSAAGQWEEITAEKRFRRLQWSRPIISLAGDDIVALTPPNPAHQNPRTPPCPHGMVGAAMSHAAMMEPFRPGVWQEARQISAGNFPSKQRPPFGDCCWRTSWFTRQDTRKPRHFTEGKACWWT